MEERASGIILRTRPLTETSLIVEWLTRDQGRIATVAKGARRLKSPFTGKLDLFYEGDLSFMRSRKSELHALREVNLRETNAKLREDLERLNAAVYVSVLIEKGTERETPIPEFHALLSEALAFLAQGSPGLKFVFAAEVKFLRLIGAAPFDRPLSSPAKGLLEMLLRVPFETALGIMVPRAILAELSSALKEQLGMNLERVPAQRERVVRGF